MKVSRLPANPLMVSTELHETQSALPGGASHRKLRWIALAMLLTGCDKYTEPAFKGLEIRPYVVIVRPEGHATVTLEAIAPDGKQGELDATQVMWSSQDPDVVEVAGQGSAARLHAKRPGIASVNARYGPRSAFLLVSVSPDAQPRGVLRHSPTVARYFVDSSGAPVYLTGSHVWSNFQDRSASLPPAAFDFDRYLDFLQMNGHNHVRLWRSEQANWVSEVAGNYWTAPMPYVRSGPGTALDGLPRFDLDRFHEPYFARLRDHVAAARNRGIFVSVMLFNGWSVEAKGSARGNPWRGHPLNRQNNINGIDGDPNRDDSGRETHQLVSPAVQDYQRRYVRKVVETLNEYDNILYEISNESTVGSMPWQYEMMEYIRRLESTLPAQHPVGLSVERPGESNDALFASSADWVAAFRESTRPLEPFPARVGHVSFSDTDHLCGVCGTTQWVWKAMLRGHNPLMMDPYDEVASAGAGARARLGEENWNETRRNMGYARVVGMWLDLRRAEPFGGIVSTGYGLGSLTGAPSRFAAFVPAGEELRTSLGFPKATMRARWLNTVTGELTTAATVATGGADPLRSPFDTDSVLLLESSQSLFETPPAANSPNGQ